MNAGSLITSIRNALGTVSTIQTNEVLRERIAFILEQMDVLEKAEMAAKEEMAELIAENRVLTEEVARYRAKEQFVYHRTAAFRKDASGSYIRAVFCPNCLLAVGADFADVHFYCRSCGWSSEFEGRQLDEVMKTLP